MYEEKFSKVVDVRNRIADLDQGELEIEPITELDLLTADKVYSVLQICRKYIQLEDEEKEILVC
ncbi:unnamed protein product [Arabis nemorensis]|uniref:Uncharacterized protein n=1 Tax=Arabis nemorensis TaxID=586526 RepID=A0A565BJU4_9BRAS|nr:unnamed protein product [Arabis nemorensis]